jgi:biopolymer transport protein TolR
MAGSNFKKGQTVSEMNVVPFIDIMLVLLIVFMITTPVINESVKVDLPKAAAEKIEVTTNTPILIISVNNEEKVFLSINGAPIKVNDISDLKGALQKEVADKPDAQLFLRGDKGVSYGVIMNVMTSLKNSGFKDIGLMTEANE